MDPAVADNELIIRCRDGDEAAFNILYQRYRLQLYSYLHKLLAGQRADVDDLYQQVWIRALENLPRYQEQQKFLSWIFRIAHNLVVDRYRKRRHEVELAMDENVAADERAPWAGLAEGELQKALAKAVRELPPEQREVVVLRQQGVPFKEIACIQDTSINTVLGRMHYAVSKLQESLHEYK